MRLVGVSQGRRGKAAHVLGEKGSSGNCVDDPFWVDSFGNKCIDDVSEDYCRDGGYGPGWGNLGTFFDRASMDGIDASKVCCACRGGGDAEGEERGEVPREEEVAKDQSPLRLWREKLRRDRGPREKDLRVPKSVLRGQSRTDHEQPESSVAFESAPMPPSMKTIYGGFHNATTEGIHTTTAIESKPMSLEQVRLRNHATRQSVTTWIKREDWESPPSLFNYGLPASVFHLIDKDVGAIPIQVCLHASGAPALKPCRNIPFVGAV